MAFPTTPQLDNFTRANENPLDQGGNWGVDLLPGTDNLQVLSNLCAATVDGFCDAWRDNTTYGPDSEAWCVAPTWEAAKSIELTVRIVNPGAAGLDGYLLHVAKPDVWEIYRIDNSAQTKLGVTATQAVANGDSIGLEAVGTSIRGYHRSGAGSWNLIMTRIDATYNAVGNIGLVIEENVTRVSSFGGGTSIPAATGRPPGQRLPLLGVG